MTAEDNLDFVSVQFDLHLLPNTKSNVAGVPGLSVFIFHESRFHDRTDQCELMVVVPATCKSDKIGISVDRLTKRISLLLRILADGTWLKRLTDCVDSSVKKWIHHRGFGPRLVR
jgi:hypothetical protein